MVRRVVGTIAVASVLTLAAGTDAIAQKANPCAAKDPCAAKNPCAPKSPIDFIKETEMKDRIISLNFHTRLSDNAGRA